MDDASPSTDMGAHPATDRRAPPSDAQESRGGLVLGRIAGVEVAVDPSLLVIFALVAFNLGSTLFPSWHPDWSAAATWGLAAAGSLLFFGSILLHELSHAVVGRSQGIAIRRVTLFLFGGVAHMEEQPSRPRAEFFMAIVGPLTSLAIGIAATGAGVLMAPAATPEVGPDFEAMGPLPTLLLWLGPVNVGLALFNVLPGFPLDGGRVLRAVVWAATGDVVRATRVASTCGRLVAAGLIGAGLFELFVAGSAQGLWLMLIGWFLAQAARSGYEQVLLEQSPSRGRSIVSARTRSWNASTSARAASASRT